MQPDFPWFSQIKAFFGLITTITLLTANLEIKADEPNKIIMDFSQLIGVTIDERPITAIEATSMEPVCKLVLVNHHSGESAFWWGTLKDHPILLKPEYNMARNAMWLHHYCWGKLAKFRFFFENDKALRAHFLESWFNEIDFSIKSMRSHNPNYPYKQVFYTELAENYCFDHKYELGVSQARKAIEVDSKHSKAYEILADCYIKLGNKGKALDAVTEGLKKSFPTRGLKNRYSEFGGKLPFPAQESNSRTPEITQISPEKSSE